MVKVKKITQPQFDAALKRTAEQRRLYGHDAGLRVWDLEYPDEILATLGFDERDDLTVLTPDAITLDFSEVKVPKGVPHIPDLDALILEAIEASRPRLDLTDMPEAWPLNMEQFHAHDSSCGTGHCRAGWAIEVAGDEGRALERKYGAAAAGALLYLYATGSVPGFDQADPEGVVEEDAYHARILADITRAAKAQRELYPEPTRQSPLCAAEQNTRFVVTHLNVDGTKRVLTQPAVGTFTYRTRRGAERIMRKCMGEMRRGCRDPNVPDTCAVVEVACWPVSNDPTQTVWEP